MTLKEKLVIYFLQSRKTLFISHLLNKSDLIQSAQLHSCKMLNSYFKKSEIKIK